VGIGPSSGSGRRKTEGVNRARSLVKHKGAPRDAQGCKRGLRAGNPDRGWPFGAAPFDPDVGIGVNFAQGKQGGPFDAAQGKPAGAGLGRGEV